MFLYRNVRKQLLVSSLIQCNFDYTCLAWCSGLLNAPLRFHVRTNEFKTGGLLPADYRVEQLKLGHMLNILDVHVKYYKCAGTRIEPATWYVLFQD